MPWSVSKTIVVPEGQLDNWIYDSIPATVGGLQDAIEFVPDTPLSDTWTRVGFYVVGLQVAGKGLMGQVQPIIRGPVGSGPPLQFISNTWIGGIPGFSGQVEFPLIAFSIQPWIGPGQVKLWVLT